MSLFYFGCNRLYGHHLWEVLEDGELQQPRRAVPTPWTEAELDAGEGPRRLWDRGNKQREGYAHLYHRDGWTLLAFPDRSVDHRFGSHSNFITDAVLNFEQMCALCKRECPQVWDRFSFAIVEANTPSVR